MARRATTAGAKGYGFDAYTSDDLTRFDGSLPDLSPPARLLGGQKFLGAGNAFLPGWLLPVLPPSKRMASAGGHRFCVPIIPWGLTRSWSDGPVTPRDWECLDGTLYVDGEGKTLHGLLP